jgi:hypothetical protein
LNSTYGIEEAPVSYYVALAQFIELNSNFFSNDDEGIPLSSIHLEL